MNGAESLVRTAVDAGVDVCFANPGTTEMPLVAALDAVPGMRGILGLFEGVCTGAADGYARMTGRPAMTLLHLGPGFANGIANLHNARRAPSPVLNVIGDHATWHRAADAPLTSDVVSLASPVSCHVETAKSAAELGRDTARAIEAALAPPGGVSTLIVPADVQWGEGGAAAGVGPPEAPRPPAREAIEDAAVALRVAERPAILLRGAGLLEEGLAGLRAGVMVGPVAVCEALADQLGPWALSHPARWVMAQAVQDRGWQQLQRERLRQARQRLNELLSKAGLFPQGDSDLFALCVHDEAEAIRDGLARQGILVRHFKQPGALRFGLPENESEEQRLLLALQTLPV